MRNRNQGRDHKNIPNSLRTKIGIRGHLVMIVFLAYSELELSTILSLS